MDKDETGGPKGKSTLVSRVGHEYVKLVHSLLFYLYMLQFVTPIRIKNTLIIVYSIVFKAANETFKMTL